MMCFERRNEVEDKPASSERGKIKMDKETNISDHAKNNFRVEKNKNE